MEATGMSRRGIASPIRPLTGSVAADGAARVGRGAHLVRDLNAAFGKHDARSMDAEGTLLRGRFEPTAASRSLSCAGLFTDPATLIVRFSKFAGHRVAVDNDPRTSPRIMAIRFGWLNTPGFDLIAHNSRDFPARTRSEFDEVVNAMVASSSGSGVPTPIDRLLEKNPAARSFLTTQRPAPISYATTAYFGVHAVTFVDGGGRQRAVRFRFLPVAGEHYFAPGVHCSLGRNYLEQEATERLAWGPIRFDWYAQIAEAGDCIDDLSAVWPDTRALIKLGSITMDARSTGHGASESDPLSPPDRMPDGIAPAGSSPQGAGAASLLHPHIR